MWPGILQSGLASTTVDFTNELSLLIDGLVGFTVLSVVVIVFLAVRYHLSQPTIPEVQRESVFTDHRDAA